MDSSLSKHALVNMKRIFQTHTGNHTETAGKQGEILITAVEKTSIIFLCFSVSKPGIYPVAYKTDK